MSAWQHSAPKPFSNDLVLRCFDVVNTVHALGDALHEQPTLGLAAHPPGIPELEVLPCHLAQAVHMAEQVLERQAVNLAAHLIREEVGNVLMTSDAAKLSSSAHW
eukprot:805350-Pelagomonas_calceolata.AAC.12